MNSEWEKTILGNLIDIKHGYAFKGEFFSDTGTDYVLVTPGNFQIGGGFKEGKNKYYEGVVPKEYLLHPNDIIVTMTDLSKLGDTLGYSALVPYSDKKHYLHNQRIGLIQFLSPEIFPEFAYWRLRNRDYHEYIVNCASGSTVKHTAPKTIRAFSFQLPKYAEQKAIAATLSCLDDKIELNNHMNKTLEEMAQAIFKSWFVDFEPFQDGEFVDSELGRIPKGWRVGTLSDICSYNGKRISIESLSIDTYISTENMLPYKAGYVSASSLPSVSQTIKFCKGDILISNIRPYFKKIVFCDHEGGCSTDVLCFTSKRLQFASYTYFIVFADKFFDFMMAGSKGTKMPRGDKKQIMQYKIVIPSDIYLTTFSNIINPFLLQISQNKIEMNRLSSLRDTLLPKLMSGEIRVPVQED